MRQNKLIKIESCDRKQIHFPGCCLFFDSFLLGRCTIFRWNHLLFCCYWYFCRQQFNELINEHCTQMHLDLVMNHNWTLYTCCFLFGSCYTSAKIHWFQLHWRAHNKMWRWWYEDGAWFVSQSQNKMLAHHFFHLHISISVSLCKVVASFTLW